MKPPGKETKGNKPRRGDRKGRTIWLGHLFFLKFIMEVETVDNGKDKSAIMTTGTGDTGNTGYRRTWSKPIVKRIEIKQTMFGAQSGADISNFATPSP